MLEQKVIEDFFRKYGCAIHNEAKTKTEYGVVMPAKRYASDMDHFQYRKMGFEAKQEYTMLSLANSDFVQQKAMIWIGDGEQVFRVVSTDFFYYANKPLYRKSYLQQYIRENKLF